MFVFLLCLYRPRWDVYWALSSGGILSLASSSALCWKYRRALHIYTFVVIEAAFVFWYLIAIVQTGLRGDFWLGGSPALASPEQLIIAALLVCTVKLGFSLIYVGLRSASVSGDFCVAGDVQKLVPLWVIAIYFVVGLVPFIQTGVGFGEAVSAGRSVNSAANAYLMQGGGLSVYLLTYFLVAACVLACGRVVFDARPSTRFVALALALAGSGLIVVSQGTRTVLLSLSMPAVTYLFLGSTRRNSGVRTLAVVALIALIGMVAEYSVQFRNRGFQVEDVSLATDANHRRLFLDNDFYSELVFGVATVPSIVAPSFESPIVGTVAGLVPRAVWPNRPTVNNTMDIMRLRMGTDSIVGNILPGVVGQYWGVGMWFGVVVLSGWLGLGAAVVDRMISRSTDPQLRYLWFAFVWSVFVGFRCLATSLFIPTALSAAAVLMTTWLSGGQRRSVSARR